AIDALARRHHASVLPAFAPGEPASGERPTALLGHGLRRALLVADQLVWRRPAERVERAETPPAPGLSYAVRTEEDQVYWGGDVRTLPHGLPPVPLPEPGPSHPVPIAPPPSAPPPFPVSRRAAVSSPGGVARPKLFELRPEDVEPMDEPAEALPA